jgi:hypothetical protein
VDAYGLMYVYEIENDEDNAVYQFTVNAEDSNNIIPYTVNIVKYLCEIGLSNQYAKQFVSNYERLVQEIRQLGANIQTQVGITYTATQPKQQKQMEIDIAAIESEIENIIGVIRTGLINGDDVSMSKRTLTQKIS